MLTLDEFNSINIELASPPLPWGKEILGEIQDELDKVFAHKELPDCDN